MQTRDDAEPLPVTRLSIDQRIIPNNAPTLNVLIQMKNDNRSDYTINFTRKALNFLMKHTSLGEPEAVKQFIAQLKTSNSYKRNLCIAYNKYCKFYKIEWSMPLYLPEAKNIKLPTREKLLMLAKSQNTNINQTETKHGNGTKTRKIMQIKSERHRFGTPSSEPNNR